MLTVEQFEDNLDRWMVLMESSPAMTRVRPDWLDGYMSPMVVTPEVEEVLMDMREMVA
tara:strand:- start:10 stop:183 length:174 start_codon:yes stop_codon:yes gene_type:complete